MFKNCAYKHHATLIQKSIFAHGFQIERMSEKIVKVGDINWLYKYFNKLGLENNRHSVI